MDDHVGAIDDPRSESDAKVEPTAERVQSTRTDLMGVEVPPSDHVGGHVPYPSQKHIGRGV